MGKAEITNLTVIKIREKIRAKVFGKEEMRYCAYFKINGKEERHCFLSAKEFFKFLLNLRCGLKYATKSGWHGRYVPPKKINIAQPSAAKDIFWRGVLATVYPFTKRELEAIEKLSFEIKITNVAEVA